MSTCTKCASLKADARLEAHPALRRRGVSHTFLDVFENYVCLNCGANWERAILGEEKRANKFRWKLTGVPIEPMTQTILTIDCARDHTEVVDSHHQGSTSGNAATVKALYAGLDWQER